MYHTEKFNSISHLVGTVLALMAFGSLLTVGIQQQSIPLFIGFLTFGLTLVLLYSFSTLYHSFKHPLVKRIFQKLDHISIYLLIAGTYTPFTLVTLYGSGGIWLLIAVWSLAIIGITLELVIKNRIEWLQLGIYLIMGWLVVFDFGALKDALTTAGIWWLTAGGIAYTVGIIFYVLDDKNLLKHAHGIWHLFVIGGSFCHFITVIAYVR
ncbi:PAQR family membrane homeostasis protein TrhA [Hydrogenovibrio marinus]|uniref:Hemolysin III n=1 Tax=Hydrogenovibrio marinus TaxID=28885 RepID=A0A066ZRX5_HYDMR|nr:hemolysin III family protein [Hydrogenovibrio marinus]KDN95034.1 hemolysin III [Hydrogenovibrio marinus]BBN59500.1 hemolysin III [Hydrogenovibrio marinus]